MPKLVKKIDSHFIDILKNDLLLVNNLEVKIGIGQYFELNSLIAFNQNYGFIVSLINYPPAKTFGLGGKYVRKNLKISY